MAVELLDQTMEVELLSFRPSDHFLGLVQKVVASRKNMRIVLPRKGGVIIFPERGEYYTNVLDMASFCQAPVEEFVTTLFGEESLRYAVDSPRSIKELLWQSAFYVSQGRLPEGCSKYDVIQFRHWPNLTRLPVTPNAAHICALLTRTPTTIMLVRRILDIPRAEVYQIYSAASSAGIATKVHQTPESKEMEIQMANVPPAPAQGLFRALFAKILGL